MHAGGLRKLDSGRRVKLFVCFFDSGRKSGLKAVMFVVDRWCDGGETKEMEGWERGCGEGGTMTIPISAC
jgi:hypothetical protein